MLIKFCDSISTTLTLVSLNSVTSDVEFQKRFNMRTTKPHSIIMCNIYGRIYTYTYIRKDYLPIHYAKVIHTRYYAAD